MKWIAMNMVSLGFLVLAGYIIHLNKDGWGWCIFGAMVCMYSSETKSSKN